MGVDQILEELKCQSKKFELHSLVNGVTKTFDQKSDITK